MFCVQNVFFEEISRSFCIMRARAGLGPSPGWGPVRVGAHMGPPGQVLAGPDMSDFRLLVEFCMFGVPNYCFLSYRSASFLGQETHEHVKTIKKSCLEAKNDIF